MHLPLSPTYGCRQFPPGVRPAASTSLPEQDPFDGAAGLGYITHTLVLETTISRRSGARRHVHRTLLLTTYCLLLTTYCSLLTTCFLLLAMYYVLLTTYYLLLATYYLLLTTYYLQLTTYYLLLTTYYLLLTTGSGSCHVHRTFTAARANRRPLCSARC